MYNPYTLITEMHGHEIKRASILQEQRLLQASTSTNAQ